MLIFYSYKKNLIFIKICGQTHLYQFIPIHINLDLSLYSSTTIHNYPPLPITIYPYYSQKRRSWTWRGSQENTVILFLRSSILYALRRRHSFYGFSFGSFILYALSSTPILLLLSYTPLLPIFSPIPPYPLLFPLLSSTFTSVPLSSLFSLLLFSYIFYLYALLTSLIREELFLFSKILNSNHKIFWNFLFSAIPIKKS